MNKSAVIFDFNGTLFWDSACQEDSWRKYLKTCDIPDAIATASGKTNVEFFIKQFDLLKYFSRENIIYNDGGTKGKPHPDLSFTASCCPLLSSAIP